MKRNLLRQIAVCAALMAGVCSAAHSAALGLHAGRDDRISQYDDFGTWLGKPVMYRVTFADAASWDSIASPSALSTGTKPWLASNPSRYEVVTIPLMPDPPHTDAKTNANIAADDATLAAIAAGTYDPYFRELAQNLATRTGAPQRIIVRLGWELNGNWYTWNALHAPASYAAAYRHVVHTMRSICNVLRFEWNLARTGSPTATGKPLEWDKAYPGDDVVDIVSMDVYDEHNTGWSDVMGGAYGFAAFRQFARKHGKSEAYTEWSVSTHTHGHGDDTAFVQGMHDWIAAGGANVLYHGYWNTSAGGPNGVIYSDSNSMPVTVPNSSALYKKLFGR